MSGHRLKIAAAGGLRQAADAANMASRAGADLLVLPNARPGPAEPSDGALAHELGEVAAAHAQPLLFAYVEACSGQRHAALQLVQADGRATANYRATHLGDGAAQGGLAAGNWLTMAEFGGSRVGLLAGVDHLVPEVWRALSSLGVDLLVAVVDTAAGPADEAFLASLVRLRAIENGVAVLLVDGDGRLHGAEADGQGLVAGRTTEGLALLELEVGRNRPTAPRRPELYHQLVALP